MSKTTDLNITHWVSLFQSRSVFSWYDGHVTVDNGYKGRVHLLDDAGHRGYGQGSINLTNIRESDQGWYECRVIFPNRTPNSRNNGTWFHLAIDGKLIVYNFHICMRLKIAAEKPDETAEIILTHLSTNYDIIFFAVQNAILLACRYE